MKRGGGAVSFKVWIMFPCRNAKRACACKNMEVTLVMARLIQQAFVTSLV